MNKPRAAVLAKQAASSLKVSDSQQGARATQGQGQRLGAGVFCHWSFSIFHFSESFVPGKKMSELLLLGNATEYLVETDPGLVFVEEAENGK
jgi:hypothetical protein